MRAHLEAVETALVSLGVTTHLYAAHEISGQYFVIGGRGADDGLEDGLCGPDGSIDTEVRLTAVTGTPAGADIMLGNARDILSPGKQWTRLTVAGRSVHIKFERSEFIGIDQSVKFTNSDRHPAWGVDSYRLVSDPV